MTLEQHAEIVYNLCEQFLACFGCFSRKHYTLLFWKWTDKHNYILNSHHSELSGFVPSNDYIPSFQCLVATALYDNREYFYICFLAHNLGVIMEDRVIFNQFRTSFL